MSFTPSFTYLLIHKYIKHLLCASDKNSIWKVLKTLKEKTMKYDQYTNKVIEECTGKEETRKALVAFPIAPSTTLTLLKQEFTGKNLMLIFIPFFFLGKLMFGSLSHTAKSSLQFVLFRKLLSHRQSFLLFLVEQDNHLPNCRTD